MYRELLLDNRSGECTHAVLAVYPRAVRQWIHKRGECDTHKYTGKFHCEVGHEGKCVACKRWKGTYQAARYTAAYESVALREEIKIT